MATHPGETPITAPADPAERGPRPYRLSVRQYLRMIEAGILRDARIELLSGLLFTLPGQTQQHGYPMIALPATLGPLIPREWFVMTARPVVLGRRSRAIPDLAVVRGPTSLYKTQDPRAQDTPLIIEVADWSYGFDRGFRWRRYAAARIPVYWIVNLAQNQIEVYREPTGTGPAALYSVTETFRRDAPIPLIVAGTEVGRFLVCEVLP